MFRFASSRLNRSGSNEPPAHSNISSCSGWFGLRLKSGGSFVQHSFWADDAAEEKEIWASFLHTLAQIENPRLIHYGSYETVFLKRMKERYGGAAANNPAFVDQLIAGSVNLLS